MLLDDPALVNDTVKSQSIPRNASHGGFVPTVDFV